MAHNSINNQQSFNTNTFSYSDPFLTKSQQHIDKLFQFTNCNVFYGNQLGIVKKDLFALNGKIVSTQNSDCKLKTDFVVDCSNYVLSPGFIDIQVNGAFGIDFSLPTISLSQIELVSKNLLSYGVTSYCPTIISSESKNYQTLLFKFNEYSLIKNKKIAENLGLHLEGPFISKEKKGCHSINNVQSNFLIDKANVNEIIDNFYGNLNGVAYVTIAPEINGAIEAISYLKNKKNIRVSLGHSIASMETGLRALNAGASCLTHLFNAMSKYHHRNPGLIGLFLLGGQYESFFKENDIFYGIIADGIHTDDSALRLAYLLNFKGLILVTDCISATGLSDGNYQFANNNIEVKNFCATIKQTKTLAGSVAPMFYCVENFIRAVKCKLDEALQSCTWKPACFLGVENRKGALKPGNDADFLLLQFCSNGSLTIKATFIAGTLVYVNDSWTDPLTVVQNFD